MMSMNEDDYNRALRGDKNLEDVDLSEADLESSNFEEHRMP